MISHPIRAFSVRQLPIFAFTIVGVYRLNCQVRYGSGCFPIANITVLLAFSFQTGLAPALLGNCLSFIAHGSSKNKHQLRLTLGYSLLLEDCSSFCLTVEEVCHRRE